MTGETFDAAYWAFCRRRPSRPFVIEFASGQQLLIGHPEAVRNEGPLYVMRTTDGGHVVFDADSVCRILDVAMTASGSA